MTHYSSCSERFTLKQQDNCQDKVFRKSRIQSVGHDGKVAELKSKLIHERIGRPRAKSLFYSLSSYNDDQNINIHPKLYSVNTAAYGLAWKENEKCQVILFFLFFGTAWNVLITFDPGLKLFHIDFPYWIKLLIQNLFFVIVFTVCGFFVSTYDWKDSYSRRCCHVAMYLTPLLIHLMWSSPMERVNRLPGVWAMS